jgi:PadR family transcriptional regulator, regulatory protein PadR
MPSSDPLLGEFEQLVLLALVRLGENAYGMTVREEIARRARRDVSLGSVYKTLERLKDKGLVSATIGEPTPERGGRRKKFFHLAPSGARALRHALAALRRMTDGLAWETRL